MCGVTGALAFIHQYLPTYSCSIQSMNVSVPFCFLKQNGMSKFEGEKRTSSTAKQAFQPTFVGQTVP